MLIVKTTTIIWAMNVCNFISSTATVSSEFET